MREIVKELANRNREWLEDAEEASKNAAADIAANVAQGRPPARNDIKAFIEADHEAEVHRMYSGLIGDLERKESDMHELDVIISAKIIRDYCKSRGTGDMCCHGCHFASGDIIACQLTDRAPEFWEVEA